MPQAITSAECGRCSQTEFVLDKIVAPFRYQFPLDSLIVRFKKSSELSLANLLVSLSVPAFSDTPDALVPVPLHQHRLRERGFDQALLLAQAIAKLRAIPVLDALERTRDTGTQGGLSAKARVHNVHGAFAVRLQSALPERVALIDDVATTGATLNACAKVLKRAGVREVQAWVIARA
jgi:ComF family protein